MKKDKVIGEATGGLDTTVSGTQGSLNAEEVAFEGIVKALYKCDFPPVLYCGSRKFSEVVEIVSSQAAMLSRDQRRLLKKTAEKTGIFVLNASKETVASRSGIAWQVDEMKYPVVRTSQLDPDEVRILPRRVTVH